MGDYYEKTGDVWTTYYRANGEIVGYRRSTGCCFWVSGDHLHSTALVTYNSGSRQSERRYRAWGASRYASGTMATTYRFTGQREDATIGLYFYNARYYDAALGRFVQADTVVPGAGDPQALNRYAYTLNNPLRYTDPSGHDVMLVGGFMTNDWDNPEGWKEWIMAYKGWSEAEWESFREQWKNVAGRQQLMAETGVHIFNWNACDCAGGPGPLGEASSKASVAWAEKALYEQMKGMRDITLVGHSKGGNLVLNFVRDLGNYTWGGGVERPKNAVIIDAPKTTIDIVLLSRGKLTWPSVAGSGVNTVNIYNAFDPVNAGPYGYVYGATNHLDLGADVNRRRDYLWPLWAHSNKSRWANIVLHRDLQVQYDHGVERAGAGL